jgi:hypothetical protein
MAPLLNTTGPAADKAKATLATEKANLKRLTLYLVPRFSYVDAFGLAAAQVSARDALARMESLIPPAVSACGSECPIPTADPDAYNKCVLECTAKPLPELASVQKKFKSRYDLDWLFLKQHALPLLCAPDAIPRSRLPALVSSGRLAAARNISVKGREY